MKSRMVLALIFVITSIVSCSPSEETITVAIAQTQDAWTPIPSQTPNPTYTPYPTYTPIPSFTFTPTVQPTATAFSTTTPEATNTRRPTRTRIPTPETGKWDTYADTSAFDDSPTVLLRTYP